ncbi:MAG: glycosyltransferase family 4 protein [Candidatus Thermoplasmatota archaeon]|jgi:glycosyltransferase involved in cell wall biosynthesis|nr:glycosyltransferase family 4 protein [Candidatus Thermoplasmatota archaeon]
MPKICFIGNSDSIHLQRWSRWFVNRGYDVHLITPGKTKIQGVSTNYLKKTKNPMNYFLRIIRTIRILRRLKPQVIIAHYASGTETFAAALSHQHPFIVIAWGSDIAIDPEKSKILKTEVKYVLRKADIVHTGDQFGKERLMQLGCNEQKIFVQPWGVDVEIFEKNIATKKPCKFVILSANRWEPSHHVDVLIKAVPSVVKEKEDTQFILLGGGIQEEELKILSKTLGIEKHINFIGHIDHQEIPQYLFNTDILVDTDIVGNNAGAGIGVINLEAMICGVPILLSEREYLKNRGKSLRNESWYCSLIYQPGDSIDLSKKILELLNDESLRKKISEREKKIAYEIGDWNKNMEKLEKIILNRRWN